MTGAVAEPTGERHTQIAENLSRVRDRIASACAESGRDPGEVTLTVVTKFFPATDVRILAGLDVHDMGENRFQEAAAKAAETEDLGLRWHFIGNLQSNKAAAVAQYADVVESLDRKKLLPGLSRGAQQRGATLDCLVQVDLGSPGDRGGGRSGVATTDAVELAGRVAEAEGLRLRGVMAVAPLDQDPALAFEKLAGVAQEIRRIDSSATWMSAGMSADLEAAIRSGATHVRVGSAVLGSRPPIK
ncbi:MAG: YggS family pyridoxal phosphate-dependent enzyme [Actinomycetota bacterium]|nr:YggS family pyridoxal phosphate-dependent enzyme [Actinomycetota bacterium]